MTERLRRELPDHEPKKKALVGDGLDTEITGRVDDLVQLGISKTNSMRILKEFDSEADPIDVWLEKARAMIGWDRLSDTLKDRSKIVSSYENWKPIEKESGGQNLTFAGYLAWNATFDEAATLLLEHKRAGDLQEYLTDSGQKLQELETQLYEPPKKRMN